MFRFIDPETNFGTSNKRKRSVPSECGSMSAKAGASARQESEIADTTDSVIQVDSHWPF